MRKKLLTIFSLSLLSLFLVPTLVLAQQKSADGVVTTSADYQRNTYLFNDKIDFDTEVAEDVVLAGEEVRVTANVTGNLIVAGGEVQVDGNVLGDVFIAAGNLVVNGDVSGDLRVAGGQIYINSANISGDLVVAAGKLDVSEDTLVGGKQLLSTGSQNTSATSNPTTIKSIPGTDFDYADMARIGGIFAVVILVINIVLLIGWYILNYALLRLFPVLAEDTLNTMKEEPLMTTIIGLALMIFAPGIAITLLISGIGIPMLFFLAALMLVAYFFANVYGVYALTRWVLVKLNYKNTGRALVLFLGMLTMFILNLIPTLGWLVGGMLSFLLPAWAIGAMTVNKWRMIREMGK